MQQKNPKKQSHKKTNLRHGQMDALWYFERLDRVNRAMQGTDDLEQMMINLLDTLLAVFECDRAWLVYPCDPDSPTWQVPMERTRPEYPGVLPIGVELPLDPVGARIYRILRNANGPVKFGEGEEHAVPAEIAAAFKVQSFIAMAFYPKIGKPWSFGLHQCSHARVWSPDEERLFQEIGRRLSDALSTLLAYRDMQESAAQIEQLIDASPVAMVVSAGEDERVIKINDKFIELFGYTAEEMPDVEHWWPLAYPDQRYREEIQTQWKEKARKAMQEKSQIEPIEARVTCKDGSIRYVQFQFSSIGEQHLVTFVDLTARIQAEFALKEREIHSQSLVRLSRKLEQAQTYSDVVNAAQDEVREVIGYRNLWAYLLTEDKKYAHALFATGPFEEVIMSEDGTATLSIQGDKMLEEIAEAREIVIVEDARIDPRTNKEIVAALGSRTIVNVPIILFDRHMGSVGTGTFGEEGVRVPSASEREYLMALASHMAVTLDRIHLLNKRKQTEQELIAREKDYRILVETIPDLIVRYDKNLQRIYVNPAWEKSSGLSASEAINRHPADTPKIASSVNKEYMEKLQQVLTTGNPQTVEFAWVNAFGETLLLEYFIVPEYDQHRNINGVLAIGRDITERKRMEEALAKHEREFRTLAENSPDNIARYDVNCRTIYVNPTMEKTLGCPASEILGTFPSESGLIKEAKEYQEKIAKMLRTGKEQEMDLVLPDIGDGVRYHNIRFVAERGADGTITGVLAIGRDITERKRAEEALRNSERRLSEAQRIAHVGYWERNFETGRIILSDEACRIFGLSPQEVPFSLEQWHQRWLELIHPDDQSRAGQAAADALKNGPPYNLDYRIVRPDGEVRFVHSEASVRRNESGRPLYMLGMMQDITERKRVEESLRQSEQKFRALAENIPNVVFQCRNDARYTFVYLNNAIDALTGYSKEDFIEKGLSFFDLYHSDDLLGIPKPGENNESNINRGPYHVTYRIRHKSGEWRWVDEWGTGVVNESGEVEYIEGIMIDITEQKRAEQTLRESEERYRQLVELSPDAIGAFRDGKIVFVNSAAVRMAGVENAGDLIDKPIKDLVPAESWEATKQDLEQLAATNKPSPFIETKFIPPKGVTLNVEAAAIPFDYQGKRHIQIIARDITERKRHEREREAIITVSTALRQASRRAEILYIILDQMLALFDAGGTFMALLQPNTGDVVVELGRGFIGEKFSGLKIPQSMGVSRWVITNKQPYLNNSAHTDPLFYRPDLLEDHHCVASVPLIAHEQSIGALWIACRNHISEQDLKLLTAVADIAANAIHRITLHEQTELRLHHLLALHQIDLAITANFDLNITLNILLTNVQTELDVDAAAILLFNESTDSLEYVAGLGFRTEKIVHTRAKLKDGIAGRAAFEQRTAACPDLNLAGGEISRSSLIVAEEFASHFATPLLVQGRAKGVLEVFHRKPLDPDQEWFNYFETLATQAVIAIENATLLQNLQLTNKELTQAYDATIEGWSRALDLRDRETEGHTQRVTEMSLELANKMGMSEIEKVDLRRGALLHDIGKMGVPDAILHKPGDLTESEWQIMRQHPLFAYQMLSPITYLKRAIQVSYYHHEKWDGTGYPHGLKGEEIPLAARVFAVVDVFDALTSDRPYRNAWSKDDAYRYIEAHAGTHFDPQVVKVFLENRKK